jgi:hypothetical protein
VATNDPNLLTNDPAYRSHTGRGSARTLRNRLSSVRATGSLYGRTLRGCAAVRRIVERADPSFYPARREVGMAKIEVTLVGKLADGRDTLEGTDDTIKLRDHGVELFESGTMTVIPWHRVKEVVRTVGETLSRQE